MYQNEAFVGNVLHEYISSGKIKREDLFITTKVFLGVVIHLLCFQLPFTGHSPADVATIVEGQLKALQLDYIDLYLIHCPFPFKVLLRCYKTLIFQRQENGFAPLMENGHPVPDNIPLVDTWHALEKLHEQGKLKVGSSSD